MIWGSRFLQLATAFAFKRQKCTGPLSRNTGHQFSRTNIPIIGHFHLSAPVVALLLFPATKEEVSIFLLQQVFQPLLGANRPWKREKRCSYKNTAQKSVQGSYMWRSFTLGYQQHKPTCMWSRFNLAFPDQKELFIYRSSSLSIKTTQQTYLKADKYLCNMEVAEPQIAS